MAEGIDWGECIFCQETKSEGLECPAKSKRKDRGQGYVTLQTILTKFRDADALPKNFDLNLFTAEVLTQHSASWHKSCRVKYSATSLEHVKSRKRTLTEQELKQTQGPSGTKYTRSSTHSSKDTDANLCFICDGVVETNDRYRRVAATTDLDEKVRRCAIDLGESKILTKLAAGDVIAIDAVYHANCLTALYKRHSKFLESSDETVTNKNVHGIVLAELVAYINESRHDSDTKGFKMPELAKLYNERLRSLGVLDENVHVTRLKNRILAKIPDLTCHTDHHSKGQTTLLVFMSDVGDLVSEAIASKDYDSDALQLARAADIVRKEMFEIKQRFNGSFPIDCQQRSVPPLLKALVDMVLQGPSIRNQTNHSSPDHALSIAQLLLFNSVKHVRAKSKSGNMRHTLDREKPLPLYVGLKIHTLTRRKDLVDIMFDLGMSVSYERVLQVITDIANGVCERFEAEKVVCPMTLKHGIFTVAALDNIDHNPSSTTAHDSFHGTSISVFQFPTTDNPGITRNAISLNLAQPQTRKVRDLLEDYTDVVPARLHTTKPFVPQMIGPMKPAERALPNAMNDEYEWLQNVRELFDKDQMGTDDFISWAAFHAARQPQVPHQVMIGALLPLFSENAHTVAMIKHGMEVVRKTVNHLNPGQIPVMAVDQPLYALAKQVQWCWPDLYGEDKYVIMWGGLHIEMAALRTLGTWLQGSGWVEAIIQANIATSGTADSFLKAAHLTRTRHAQQVTAACLYILQHQAYRAYTEDNSQEEVLDFKSWKERQTRQSPMFQYWQLTMEFQLLILAFVRAEREGNFALYVEALNMLMPWMFALDSTHYARWLLVHIRDMSTLSLHHQEVFEQFSKGNFILHKTCNVFSGMAIDQGHEQNNAIIKGTGGAVGLTENPSAFRRWMIAGPELARLLPEFEQSFGSAPSDTTFRHHEQVPSIQNAFKEQVSALVKVFEQMGNPFLEETDDLLMLDTRVIMDSSVKNCVRNVLEIGQAKYDNYVTERLETAAKPITDVIPKSALPLFSKQQAKTKSKTQLKVATLQDNIDLFSQLYISCQTRSINMHDFFKYENQPYPPSISDHGKLRLGKKSDLVECLVPYMHGVSGAPDVDTKIFDGAALVHFLTPKAVTTFEEYAEMVFLPFIEKQNVQRVDIVWDRYIPDSLKTSARVHRGKGERRRVLKTTKIPKNWNKFLLDKDNKTELFKFLTYYIKDNFKTEKEVYVTDDQNVICTYSSADFTYIMPCNHEEADSRLIIHACDAASKGHRKLLIRTVDTDVVVLSIANVAKLGVEEMWIAFGTGQHFRYLPAHTIASSLGPQKAMALTGFHSFTGCDTVSSFAGKGKKSAWDAWRVFPDATQAFKELSTPQNRVSEETCDLLERFLIIWYDHTSSLMDLNETRRELFTKRNRHKIENLPPTKAAFSEHVKRAAYQSGQVWGQALVPKMELPSPEAWGWSKTSEGWEPFWTTLPEASKGCREFIRCGCKSACVSRCRCVKSSLPCTPMCDCVCTQTI